MWSVLLMITAFPFVADLATAAWISDKLLDEVVIGKKYENVLVNLTTNEFWRGVSSGTLYWDNGEGGDMKMLQKVDKFDSNNLVDGYENFYFNFTITKMFYVPTRATIRPISDFSWELPWWQGKPMVNKTVHFIDKSKKGYEDIISWQWDFGDGGISHKQNPEHIYSNIGTYNVTLTIEDKNGDTDSYTRQIKIYGERNFPVFEIVISMAVILIMAVSIFWIRRHGKKSWGQNRENVGE